MTSITRGPPVPPAAGSPPNDRATRSLRAASLIAGIGILLVAVLAVFGNFIAVGALVTPGDAAKTVRDILAFEGVFRWGVANLILVAVLDIVVARALLTMFEPVNRSVSAMAAWFRVAYAAGHRTPPIPTPPAGW